MIDLALAKKAIDPELHGCLEPLLRGITKTDLEAEIARIKGCRVDDPRVDIARMNLIGGLRSFGFEVLGGRGGGKTYQIVGFAEPKRVKTVDAWTGAPRNVYDWVQSLPKVSLADENRVWTQLSSSSMGYQAHENCFGYLWSYEMARDQGFWYSDKIVILQRHVNMPRYRLFDLGHADPVELLWLARLLSQASLVPVSILNLKDTQVVSIKEYDRGGSFSRRREALYNTHKISSSPELFLNSRGMTQLRSNRKQTELRAAAGSEFRGGFLDVISTWKEFLQDRHRQLAITRDFVAVDYPTSLKFLGYRDGLPVAAYILDRLPNCPDIAADLMNKSLNYSSMPGGKAGTADWLLVEVCQALADRGINYLQAGGYDGGGVGLPQHKARFADHDFESISFTVSTPHLSRNDLEE